MTLPSLADLYNQRLASSEIQADPAQSVVLDALDKLVEALGRTRGLFRKAAMPQGIYLHGPVGRGKSMLMDLFFAAAPVAAKRRVHFNAFMLDVHRRLNAARATRRADPLAHVAAVLAVEARLLCFDEFQVKDVADAMILARLFSALLDRGVIVVATSNTAPDRLYEGGLQRELFLPFIALLKQRLDVIAVAAGVDHRLVRLRGKPVWFQPDDPTAAAAIDALFAELSEGREAAPQTLDVAGRLLKVPLAAGKVARFTFASLCGQPLGAADYLALAARYRVLIVEHIPRFDPASRNEAARFIALIDQLYETRTVLVASAASPVPKTYPADGPLAFDFRRTASRLAEMGSAGYLAILGTAEKN